MSDPKITTAAEWRELGRLAAAMSPSNEALGRDLVELARASCAASATLGATVYEFAQAAAQMQERHARMAGELIEAMNSPQHRAFLASMGEALLSVARVIEMYARPVETITEIEGVM